MDFWLEEKPTWILGIKCLDRKAFLSRYLPGIILEPVSSGLYGQALGKTDNLSIREKETVGYTWLK